ncbi:MAG: peroxiredoxin [Actinomycetota bacterium]|nr:peroxiredoxin [Actinomycetota bacterium]
MTNSSSASSPAAAPSSAAAAPGPAVGDPAPGFALPDADGNTVSLSDFAGRSVIVFCYPAAGTPGCTKEACEFTAARKELDTAGYTVIGISPDSPAKLAKFTADEKLDLVLLADQDKSVLRAYGAYGAKQNYCKTIQGVIRSTFVIGPDGKIVQALRNVTATGHVGRVLTSLGVS